MSALPRKSLRLSCGSLSATPTPASDGGRLLYVASAWSHVHCASSMSSGQTCPMHVISKFALNARLQYDGSTSMSCTCTGRSSMPGFVRSSVCTSPPSMAYERSKIRKESVSTYLRTPFLIELPLYVSMSMKRFFIQRHSFMRVRRSLPCPCRQGCRRSRCP